eukprot:scaffold105177_cov35-Tisochrysis_lutea.AAC.3
MVAKAEHMPIHVVIISTRRPIRSIISIAKKVIPRFTRERRLVASCVSQNHRVGDEQGQLVPHRWCRPLLIAQALRAMSSRCMRQNSERTANHLERADHACLRICDIRMSEHEGRVIEDSIDARELHANLQGNTNDQLFAELLVRQQLGYSLDERGKRFFGPFLSDQEGWALWAEGQHNELEERKCGRDEKDRTPV